MAEGEAVPQEKVTSTTLVYLTADNEVKMAESKVPMVVCVYDGNAPRVLHNLPTAFFKGIVVELYQQVVNQT